MDQVKNANQKPARFYGMHFLPGCAEYAEEGSTPYRVFLNEATVKSMDRTFEGCPVYVQHVDNVDFKKLEQEAAGIVVKSFWNAVDGKSWCEFVIFSDEGHEAIRKGWRLSNAYRPKDWGGPGMWNGISYDREITKAEYEHLALVPNPRYEESVIMTPEEFKAYNEKKGKELERLTNSKQGEKSVLNFFKKTKVENAGDYECLTVKLPKSGKEMTIAELVTEMDKVQNMSGYASDDHMVKCNDDEEMSVKDLRKAYNKMKEMNAEKEASEVGDEASKKAKPAMNDDDDDKGGEPGKKKNSADDEDTRIEKKVAEIMKKKGFNNSLKNAEASAYGTEKDAPVLNLNKTAQGKALYGSGR